MNQPGKPAFPEYGASHLTEDCRAHLLGAMGRFKACHEALLQGKLQEALVDVDVAIALAHEARKFILAPTPSPAPATPEEPRLL